jgi:hypothetical protein
MSTTTRATAAGLAAVLAAGLLGLTACGEDEPAPTAAPTPRVPTEVPTPEPDPDDFVDTIDNPYLPYLPGTRWVYENTSSEGDERIVVTVTDQTRMVQGVRATVVRDTVTDEDGRVVEDTFDWFAQDKAGNVWYFGEDTTAYEDGTTTKEGSWEAGVDGAQAGIVMLADPRPGDTYQQEYYEGEAEDRGEVLAVDARASVPFGSYTDMVKTADTTPLEPEVEEHKYYAEGVGFVYEEKVRGGDDRGRLVSMTSP